MAIEKRPTGEAAAVAQAGREIGQAEKAKREQQISLEQQAQDAARAWEIQKFILNSQQDFAHEQRMRQADLDVEARAKEWEKEKMELASQLDFEQDERERLRKKATLNSGMEAIDNSDAPEQQKIKARFDLKSKFMDIEGHEEALGFDVIAARQAAKPQTIYQQRKELEAIVGPEIGKFMGFEELQAEAARLTGEAPTPTPAAPTEKQRVRVIAPDGTTGTISAGEVGLPEYADFTIIDEVPPVEEPMFPSGAGATGGLTPEPKFPFRKVGSIKDLYNFLRGR